MADAARRQVLLERFERATELPLLVLALALVPLVIAPWALDLSEQADDAIAAVDWMIWGVFAFEFAVRLGLTNDRRRFLRREWPDLLIVALPLLRPLRIARSARALRLLGLTRLVALLAESIQEGRRLLTRHKLHFVLLLAGAVVLAAAVAALVAEDGSEGSIDSIGDALWWAVTTVTTVGYGDTYPVTAAGRGIGVLLMLSGITLFGVVTANLAAFFVESDHQADAPGPTAPATQQQIAELNERLDRIEGLLRARAADPSDQGFSDPTTHIAKNWEPPP